MPFLDFLVSSFKSLGALSRQQVQYFNGLLEESKKLLMLLKYGRDCIFLFSNRCHVLLWFSGCEVNEAEFFEFVSAFGELELVFVGEVNFWFDRDNVVFSTDVKE